MNTMFRWLMAAWVLGLVLVSGAGAGAAGAREGEYVVVPRGERVGGEMEVGAGAARQFTGGTDFFPGARGFYNGLLAPSGDLIPERSGYFELTVSSGGSFSGRFVVGGDSVPMRGWFNSSGLAGVSIYRWVWDDCFCFRSLVHVWTVELDLVSGTDELEGTLFNERRGGWSADLYGLKAGYASSRDRAPQEGRYTMRLPGSDDAAVAPPGDGYGAVTVNARGQVRLTGALPDGVKVTDSASLSVDGYWPLYVPLNDGEGLLQGWVRILENGSMTGDLTWIKPGHPDRVYYPAGFSGTVSVEGGRYGLAPGDPSPFTWSSGRLDVEEGNVAGLAGNLVEFLAPNRVVVSPGGLSGLTVKLNPNTGILTGTFLHPATGRKTSWAGAVFEFLDAGGGYFLGSDRGGVVRLTSGE